MTTQPEALRLADALRDSVETDGEWSQEQVVAAAAELRRLYKLLMDMQGEIYTLGMSRSMEKKMAELSFNALEKQRDALLAALKKAEENGCSTVYANEYDECGAKGCCGVVSYKPHADDCWVTTARAAIKAVEGENA